MSVLLGGLVPIRAATVLPRTSERARPMAMAQPAGGYPVSVKGVLVRADRVLLVRNDRAEWELPGGRLERGATPEQCVARQILQETGLPVTVADILDAWVYHIAAATQDVLIVTYGCHPLSTADPQRSEEHHRISEFSEHDVADLRMPEGYKRSIAAWYDRLRAAHSTG
jgi:8-oxo-dGTP pyrophosphatase MutT (NUDIX family)